MRRVVLFLLALCVMTSCRNTLYEVDMSQSNDHSLGIEKKIERDVVSLSETDVKIVSNLYSKMAKTKSNNREIKEVIPIKGEDGKVMMYAVNYADGYIIVSATKRYYPILADVRSGNFSLDDSSSGLKLLIDDFSERINMVEEMENYPDLSRFWEPYLNPVSVDIERTKANSDFYDLFESYLDEWYADGCNVYYLYNQPENMPDDMYNTFYRMAEDDMAEVNGYPFRECAVITEQTFENSKTKGPLLGTKWDQVSGFDSELSGNKKMGCVTIAVGQIMKYHEYPNTFNWSSMANGYATPASASFLATLRSKLKVADNGTTTDKCAKNAFKDYGYTCSDVLTHDNTKVVKSLNNYNPVYMSGMNKYKPEEGHAWVCDGYMYTIPSRKYTLYLLLFEDGKPSSFDSWYEETIYDTYPFFFHMNWGWGGSHNGYFLDSNMDLSSQGFKVNFSVHRKNLIVSGHN